MITQAVDWAVSVVSPTAAVKRAHARNVVRQIKRYAGAETNRLNNQSRPKNQSANSELSGPFGADSLRANARMLVRDNSYAFSALESIVSETIGTGFGVQSNLETEHGTDEEDTNENRDKIWREWCEVCDINGELTFDEMQTLAFREMVEAGECLIHYVTVPKTHKGIYRPVPLALELIEADRLASDQDTYAIRKSGGMRITRGVEMDEHGRVVAYWIYPAHPTEPNVFARTPERIPASEIKHLYRKDRIGQSRGVTWFAPIIAWLKSLGVYVDNELQASAVSSCFVAAIKSDQPIRGMNPPSVDGVSDSTDADGNQYEYLQPGLIMRLKPHESLESANPSRPNSGSEPWIRLMLQAMAAGTGTSYESVSKDFSNTSYSSSRTSKLENRPRYRRWQNYWKSHMCQPTWDHFCDAAARAGVKAFPTATELLDDRRGMAPVEFMPPVWEWVDVSAEQQSSEASINALQSTLQDELGGRGKNWRHTLYQSAKEKRLKQKLGLITPADAQAQQAAGTGNQANAMATQALSQAGAESEPTDAQSEATSELAGLSTLQFTRNRKAIEKVLSEFATGEISESKARVFLSSIGMKQESIDMLIADAADGSVDELPDDETDSADPTTAAKTDKNGIRIL